LSSLTIVSYLVSATMFITTEASSERSDVETLLSVVTVTVQKQVAFEARGRAYNERATVSDIGVEGSDGREDDMPLERSTSDMIAAQVLFKTGAD
jgi:hypothetical protein